MRIVQLVKERFHITILEGFVISFFRGLGSRCFGCQWFIVSRRELVGWTRYQGARYPRERWVNSLWLWGDFISPKMVVWKYRGNGPDKLTISYRIQNGSIFKTPVEPAGYHWSHSTISRVSQSPNLLVEVFEFSIFTSCRSFTSTVLVHVLVLLRSIRPVSVKRYRIA